MPNIPNYVRDTVPVTETPRDKGVEMTLKVTLYDNGFININDEPMGGMGGDSASPQLAGVGLLVFIGQAVFELVKKHEARIGRRSSLVHRTPDGNELHFNRLEDTPFGDCAD